MLGGWGHVTELRETKHSCVIQVLYTARTGGDHVIAATAAARAGLASRARNSCPQKGCLTTPSVATTSSDLDHGQSHLRSFVR